MKVSVIEKRLNEAMKRLADAQGEERYLTGQIDYHDAEASRIRKRRQSERARKDRAEATIRKLSAALANYKGE